MDGLVVEINLRHVVHVVTQLRLDEVVGNHGVPHLTLEGDAVVTQHLEVVLQVLSYLEDGLLFIDGSENIDHFLGFVTVGRHRNVKCLMFLDSEAQTHQFCLNGIG